MQGVIKVLREGFGFIETEGEEKDMFFHATSLEEGLDFKQLNEGEELSYEVGEGKDGRKQAINVKRV